MTRSVGAELGSGPALGIHVHDDAGLAVANSLAAVQAGATSRPGNDQRLRRALRQRQPRHHLGQPGAQAGARDRSRRRGPDAPAGAFALRGGGRQHRARRPSAVRRHQRVRSQGRRARRRNGPGRAGVPARGPDRGGRDLAAGGQRAGRPGERRAGVCGSSASLRPRAWTRRSSRRLVKQLESEGASFEGADASFELLVRRRRDDYVAPFRIVDFTVIVERRNGAAPRAEASVKVEVDGEVLHTAADGNGPVNALDLALRKALGAFYPALDDVHLVDYKVRIIDGDAATGGAHARDHRDGARDRHVAHRRRGRQHHRRQPCRPPRLARVRDLAPGRPSAAP